MGTPMAAQVIETHTAWVFFVGDRVYKAKKPLDLGFVDFRRVEARSRACADEVALNRRLAPDVYLGVADVRGPDGAWCDHLVVMRRMPSERRLSFLVSAGDDVTVEIDRIAAVIARFHAGAAIPSDAEHLGSAAVLRDRWADGFQVLSGLPDVVRGGDVDESMRLAARYLAGREALFAERAAAGYVRDGHGDLLADDIFCLPDGPRLLDCLEFDRALRIGDVLADVAFLAMDLEHAGADAAARRLLARYGSASGNRWPRSLEHHYIAYRANVRAKVSAIRAGQLDGESRARVVAAARELTALSLRHLRAGRVRLLVVGGLPGSGKSTIAAAVGERTGWPVLSSDVVRKELAGLSPDTPAPAEFDTGLYSLEHTDATYQELFRMAALHLAHGQCAIIDASFNDPSRREQAAELARVNHTDLVCAQLVVPADVAERRVSRRRPGSGSSDADVAVYRAMRGRGVPWPDAAAIEGDGSVEAAVGSVLDLVQ